MHTHQQGTSNQIQESGAEGVAEEARDEAGSEESDDGSEDHGATEQPSADGEEAQAVTDDETHGNPDADGETVRMLKHGCCDNTCGSGNRWRRGSIILKKWMARSVLCRLKAMAAKIPRHM